MKISTFDHPQRLPTTSTVARRAAATILGARSGTSALAGLLGGLGCALPRRVMRANWANPKGYFEPQDIVDLHDEILGAIGSSWNDDQAVPASWFASQDAARYAARLAAVFSANYEQDPVLVLKDPRICRLLPLWQRVFQFLGVSPVYCFIDRHPLEVAASLRARDGSSMDQGLLYYIRNHLDSELATRGQDRVMLSYEAMLKNWRAALSPLAKKLDIDIPERSSETADLDDFLEQSLHHQKSGPAIISGMSAFLDTALSVHYAFNRLRNNASDPRALESLDVIRAQFAAQPVTGQVAQQLQASGLDRLG